MSKNNMMLTDFHSHILPAMDDGSSSVKESIELLQLSAKQNIRTMVATPHFYANSEDPDSFLRRREASFNMLRRAMDGVPGLPNVVLGAEVHYYEGMWNSAELLNLRLNSVILVEMPMTRWTGHMMEGLEKLYSTGVVPVLAHIDRYMMFFRDKNLIGALSALPVLYQVNADFFLHRRTQATALGLVKERKVHFIGSDCHNLTSRRPNIGDAAKVIGKRLGEEELLGISKLSLDVLSGITPDIGGVFD